MVRHYKKILQGHALYEAYNVDEEKFMKQVNAMKGDMMVYIVANDNLLKKKPTEFRIIFWRFIVQLIRNRYHEIQVFHEMELCRPKNETSMETVASEWGNIYTKLRRAFINENIEMLLICKRMLPKNARLRRQIVNAIDPYRKMFFKRSGNSKWKRRSNVKDSTTLDKMENMEDTGLGKLQQDDFANMKSLK